MQPILFSLAIAAASVPAAAGQTPAPPADSTLAAITARGRALLRYDIASWHGGDAIVALKPIPGEINASFARVTRSGRWEVVFGRLNAAKDTFYITYRATQTDADSQFTAAKLPTPIADVGVQREMALAFQTAQQDFGRITRPYNAYVIPASGQDLWVYLLPAQTDPRIFPLGGDVRYRITGGSSIVEKVRFHNAILDRVMPQSGRPNEVPVAMVHTSFDTLPSETDVFVVLRRAPKLPEVVVTRNFLYQIAIDGTITWTRTAAQGASAPPPSSPSAGGAAGQVMSMRPVFWDPPKVRVAGLAVFDKVGTDIGRAARELASQPWTMEFPAVGAVPSWDSLRQQLTQALHARAPAAADSVMRAIVVQRARYAGDTLVIRFALGSQRQCPTGLISPLVGVTYEARSVPLGGGRWSDPQTDWVERMTGSAPPCTPGGTPAPTTRLEVRSPTFRPTALNVASLHPLVPADSSGGKCITLSAGPGQPPDKSLLGMRFGAPRIDRTVILRFDSAGKLLTYAENRGDVTAPPNAPDAVGAPPHSMISIDIARQSVSLHNDGGGKPAETSMAFGPGLLTAPSLNVPQHTIDRIVKECSKP
jgi:hypothetical protein